MNLPAGSPPIEGTSTTTADASLEMSSEPKSPSLTAAAATPMTKIAGFGLISHLPNPTAPVIVWARLSLPAHPPKHGLFAKGTCGGGRSTPSPLHWIYDLCFPIRDEMI